MTDEEVADKYAEEYFGKKTELVEVWKLKSCKENFLAGLKASRPQWHDLEKDPTDLPKEFDINKNRWEMEKRITEHIVQNQDGERVCCLNGKWYYEEGGEAYVIAWKEIVLPELPKESE